MYNIYYIQNVYTIIYILIIHVVDICLDRHIKRPGSRLLLRQVLIILKILSLLSWSLVHTLGRLIPGTHWRVQHARTLTGTGIFFSTFLYRVLQSSLIETKPLMTTKNKVLKFVKKCYLYKILVFFLVIRRKKIFGVQCDFRRDVT